MLQIDDICNFFNDHHLTKRHLVKIQFCKNSYIFSSHLIITLISSVISKNVRSRKRAFLFVISEANVPSDYAFQTKLQRNKIYKVLKYFYSILHKARALKCNEFLAAKS